MRRTSFHFLKCALASRWLGLWVVGLCLWACGSAEGAGPILEPWLTNRLYVVEGTSFDLGVHVLSEGVTTYAWFRDDSLLENESARTLTVTAVSGPAVSRYSVQVSDESGTTTSDPLEVRVVGSGSVWIQGESSSFLPGSWTLPPEDLVELAWDRYHLAGLRKDGRMTLYLTPRSPNSLINESQLGIYQGSYNHIATTDDGYWGILCDGTLVSSIDRLLS